MVLSALMTAIFPGAGGTDVHTTLVAVLEEAPTELTEEFTELELFVLLVVLLAALLDELTATLPDELLARLPVMLLPAEELVEVLFEVLVFVVLFDVLLEATVFPDTTVLPATA